MIGGDASFPDHVINTYDHFPDWLYFGCEGRGNPLSVRLFLLLWGLDFPLVFSTVGRPQGGAGKKEEAVVRSRPVRTAAAAEFNYL